MASQFPFFWFTIISHIIPGALTLAVLSYIGLGLPDGMSDLVFGTGSEKDGWRTVVLPVVLLGAAYAIGILYEMVVIPLREYYTISRQIAFEKAAIDKRKWLWPVWGSPTAYFSGALHNCMWNYLAYGHREHQQTMFFHAHRFQALSHMCLYSAFPAAAFAGASLGHCLRFALARYTGGAIGFLLYVALEVIGVVLLWVVLTRWGDIKRLGIWLWAYKHKRGAGVVGACAYLLVAWALAFLSTDAAREWVYFPPGTLAVVLLVRGCAQAEKRRWQMAFNLMDELNARDGHSDPQINALQKELQEFCVEQQQKASPPTGVADVLG
ncbi:MAG TPA: hypothetical protein PKK06_13830 [Phycisphaerae bacterium]|nr:hypothetical protein [Phycisphaerae bacterium]HNU46273.1 hypothetical protein [Phycisphaerae bacterium]